MKFSKAQGIKDSESLNIQTTHWSDYKEFTFFYSSIV